MTREQLFILLVLAFVLLINFAVRVLRKRVADEAPRAREPEAPQISPRARRPPPVVAPRRPHEGPVAAPSPRAVPPVTRRRQTGAPVGDLRTVRRGIVLMTILRPCRALEPPDDAR